MILRAVQVMQLQSATLQVLAAGSQGTAATSSEMEPSHHIQPTASPVYVESTRQVEDLQPMLHHGNPTSFALSHARKVGSEMEPTQRVAAAVVSPSDENVVSSCRDLQPCLKLGASLSPPLQGDQKSLCEESASAEASAENNASPQCMLVADGEVVNDVPFWEWAREDCGEEATAADTTTASFWEWART